MREIKFRAWCDNKVDEPYMVEWEVMQSNFPMYLDDSEIEVMQFTGLTDRNGKDIYEGDILHHKTNYRPYMCVIEWKDNLRSCGCCYDAHESIGFVGVIKGKTDYSYSKLAGEYEKMEIIGNIYQNLELLDHANS